MTVERLHPDDLERLAELVADRLAERLDGAQALGPTWLTAAEVAARFRVDRAWVYQHADELGARRLGERGEGRRPRLRFDPQAVADRLGSGPSGRRPQLARSRAATGGETGSSRQDRGAGPRSVPETAWEPLG